MSDSKSQYFIIVEHKMQLLDFRYLMMMKIQKKKVEKNKTRKIIQSTPLFKVE
jgi:hypothetical protein